MFVISALIQSAKKDIKNVMDTSTILYVPAWFPSIYMEEQIQLLSGKNAHILTGELIKGGKKKYLTNIIKRTRRYYVYEDLKNRCIRLSFLWLNSKQERINNAQLDYCINKVDEFVTNIFNGNVPKLIHFHALSEFSAIVCEWAKRKSIPIVLTEHVLYIRHEFSFLAKLREKMYESADCVLCVSNYVYRNLVVHGLKIKRAIITGNLINTKYIPNDFSKIKKNDKIIFVATHTADKDFDVLFDVVSLMNGERHVDIWGLTGDELFQNGESLKVHVKKLCIDEWICFIGKKTHEDLLKALPYYSILLSTSCSETFGLAIAEAIAYGVYVVTTDSGGMRDFVNESNAKVVPIRCPKQLYNAIVSFDNKCIHVSDVLIKRYYERDFVERIFAVYNIVCK